MVTKLESFGTSGYELHTRQNGFEGVLEMFSALEPPMAKPKIIPQLILFHILSEIFSFQLSI